MQTYYRIVPVHMGECVRFLPNGYHERFDEGGHFDNSFVSTNLEVCFAPTLEGCMYGLGNWLKNTSYFIYKTEQTPCLNLDQKRNPIDYCITREVRYRVPVETVLIGKIDVTEEMISFVQTVGAKIHQEGWSVIADIQKDLKKWGGKIHNYFIPIQSKPVSNFAASSCEIREGDEVEIPRFPSDGRPPFKEVAQVMKVHQSSSGYDCYLRVEEEYFWEHAQNVETRSMP